MTLKRSPIYCLLILIASIFSTKANAIDSLRMETIEGKSYIIHQVDQGETLYRLSKRYTASVDEIVSSNELEGSSISVGQVIKIPYRVVEISGLFHTVAEGETLYSISRMYEVSISDLRFWNRLVDNTISIGQKLSIGAEMPLDADLYADEDPNLKVPQEDKEVVANEESDEEIDTPSFTYYVQAGESLASIATKFSVSADSIQYWNRLARRRVKIGQALIFPFEVNIDSIALNEVKPKYRETSYGSKYQIDEDGGVKKLYEEGIAKVIDSQINSTKYLALHRTLSVGTVFQVKNMMNNQTIYVRVVGKLPNTGLNEGVMIRLTPKAFERLGIIDEKSLVGITYFDE